MNIKRLLLAGVLLTSTLSYAGAYYHPVTGDLVFDEDSFTSSAGCVNTEVIFSPSGIDILHQSLYIEGKGSKNCYLGLDIAIPNGWYAIVSAGANMTGYYVGVGVVTLEHTLAGNTIKPVIEYLDGGSGTYLIEQPNTTIARTACGTSTRLKTSTSLISFLPVGYLDIISGSMQYRFSWFQC